jgi:hypothetical protein
MDRWIDHEKRATESGSRIIEVLESLKTVTSFGVTA